MRLLSGTAALAAATLFSAVTATPNFEITTTSVDIDRHRERLDKGEIVVRVQRTQDLFSDPTAESAAELLLERDTHLFLKIQLDADKGKINVNDASLDIAGDDESSAITVAGIKAETFRLPTNSDNAVLALSVEEVQGLVDQMSTGIVGIEVRVESEPMTPSVPVVNFDTEAGAPSVDAVRIRQVGLWIRITEVEGKSLPHTTSIYTPILQLIVTGSGDKVKKIETLAIGGKAPIDQQAHNVPGPVMVKELPPVEGGLREKRPFVHDEDVMTKEPQHHHHGHHHDGQHDHKDGHHGHHGQHHHHEHHGHDEDEARPSGILGWITRTLDVSRWRRPSRAGSQRRPCHGSKGISRGGDKETMNGQTAPGKVIGHRPMLDNPFSGLADDDEGYESGTEGRKEIKHHMRPNHAVDTIPHRFGHKQHHRGKCGGRFLRRMAIGLAYGFAMFGAIIMHPVTLLTLSALSALAISFHIVRRLLIRRRQNAVRLGDGGEDGRTLSEDKVPLMGENEKDTEVLQEIVVGEGQDLPLYEERS